MPTVEAGKVDSTADVDIRPSVAYITCSCRCSRCTHRSSSPYSRGRLPPINEGVLKRSSSSSSFIYSSSFSSSHHGALRYVAGLALNSSWVASVSIQERGRSELQHHALCLLYLLYVWVLHSSSWFVSSIAVSIRNEAGCCGKCKTGNLDERFLFPTSYASRVRFMF
jgi:hypothetical protein